MWHRGFCRNSAVPSRISSKLILRSRILSKLSYEIEDFVETHLEVKDFVETQQWDRGFRRKLILRSRISSKFSCEIEDLVETQLWDWGFRRNSAVRLRIWSKVMFASCVLRFVYDLMEDVSRWLEDYSSHRGTKIWQLWKSEGVHTYRQTDLVTIVLAGIVFVCICIIVFCCFAITWTFQLNQHMEGFALCGGFLDKPWSQTSSFPPPGINMPPFMFTLHFTEGSAFPLLVELHRILRVPGIFESMQ